MRLNFGRMYLSGDVTNLTSEQWNVIERGMAFYKKIAPIIKEGQTYHMSPQIEKIRHPEGCAWYMEEIYSDSEVNVWVKDGILHYTPNENWKAMAVYLK